LSGAPKYGLAIFGCGKSGNVDLIVWEVGDDVPAVLQTSPKFAKGFPDLARRFTSATAKWGGAGKKNRESSTAPTRLPVRRRSRVARARFVNRFIMDACVTVAMHRRRGTCPNRRVG